MEDDVNKNLSMLDYQLLKMPLKLMMMLMMLQMTAEVVSVKRLSSCSDEEFDKNIKEMSLKVREHQSRLALSLFKHSIDEK